MENVMVTPQEKDADERAEYRYPDFTHAYICKQ